MRWLVVAFVLTAGCTNPFVIECSRSSDCPAGQICRDGDCIDECVDDRDCTSGSTCVGGRCLIAGDVGVPPDGSDAACSDGDGDSVCPPADCDDDDADVGPDAPEVCSAADTVPRDENCDGLVDEGCPFYFGAPHQVLEVHGSALDHYLPRLSPDGLTLCAADGAIQCATRETVTGPFAHGAAPDVVPPGFQVTGMAWGVGDEVFLEARDSGGAPHLVRTAGGEAISLSNEHYHPALSPDGLTLYAQRRFGPGSPARIERARRATTSEGFGDFEPVDLATDGTDSESSPFVLPDGTLLFSRGPSTAAVTVLVAAPRADFFEPPEPLPAVRHFGGIVDPAATHYAYYPATRELFFVSWSDFSSGRSTVFRVEVCRDGPCPPLAPDCSRLGSMAAPGHDGWRCFWPGATGTYATAEASCTGGHLATIHSARENTAATSLGGWLGHRLAGSGGYETVTGEPSRFTNWAMGEPAGAGAVLEADGRWTTDGLSVWNRALCEEETWPVW